MNPWDFYKELRRELGGGRLGFGRLTMEQGEAPGMENHVLLRWNGRNWNAEYWLDLTALAYTRDAKYLAQGIAMTWREEYRAKARR